MFVIATHTQIKIRIIRYRVQQSEFKQLHILRSVSLFYLNSLNVSHRKISNLPLSNGAKNVKFILISYTIQINIVLTKDWTKKAVSANRFQSRLVEQNKYFSAVFICEYRFTWVVGSKPHHQGTWNKSQIHLSIREFCLL